MRADDVLWPARGTSHLIEVQARGVAGEHGARLHGRIELLEDLLLEIEVLEHRFDHDVGVRDCPVVEHALDQVQAFIALGFGDPAAAHHASIVRGDHGQALVECFLADLEYLDRNARVGEAHGNAAAHEAAAHRGRAGDGLGRRVPGHVGDARRLPLREEHVDHGRALLVVVAALEVGAFGADPVVEIVEFDGSLDRLEGHPAVELAAHAARQVGLAGLEHVRIGAVGQDLVAPVADQRVRRRPRLVLGEGDRGVDEITVGNGVDDSEFERVLGVEGIAREDGLHGALGADQPRQPLGSTAARQQADLDLRQAHRRAGSGDPVVARQREFESTTECRAVDGRDHGFGAAFDQLPSGTLGLFVGVGCLAEIADVRPGDERPALAGNDDPDDGIVRQGGRQVLRQVEAHPRTHRVHRRVVDGQQRDVVAHLVMHGA